MKYLIIIALLLPLSLNAQEGRMKLASSHAEYIKMYQNKSIKMVRSHKDFVVSASKNPLLKKILETEAMREFLESLKFCNEGLITFSLEGFAKSHPKQLKAIFDTTSKTLGFEPPVLAADYKGYKCNGQATCVSCSNCVCLGDSCGKNVLKGPNFDPEQVLSM